MLKFLKNCLVWGCVIGLVGCGGHSDKLGLSESKDEQTKSYAETFSPAREALRAGQFDSLVTMINSGFTKDGKSISDEEIKQELIDNNSELSIVERGLLTLNSGAFERALVFFDAAEQKMEKIESDQSVFSAGSSLGKKGFAAMIGMEESAEYEMRGYEKVMLLNYKALCYMLMGDRKAYNVTRKAIDRQQEEWEKFKESLAELEEANAQSPVADIIGQIHVDNRSKDTKEKATLVSSAYVNPFGDYMNAVLQEIDSLSDPSLRDNARISYQKVLENNKGCTVAKVAAKEVMRKPSSKKKLVQVILADGFAPERKEMSESLSIAGYSAVVNFSEAMPIPTKVSGARIKVGGQSSRLASLSRMESIILRDDQDRLPWRYTMMGLALLRSGAAGAVAKEIGMDSMFGANLVSKLQRPDTRSWLSLPNQVLVARIYVPNSAKEVKIETLSGSSVIASTSVPLAAEGPTLVYAVSYDNQLKAYANKNSWIK